MEAQNEAGLWRMWIAGRARGLLARGEAANAVEASKIATYEAQQYRREDAATKRAALRAS